MLYFEQRTSEDQTYRENQQSDKNFSTFLVVWSSTPANQQDSLPSIRQNPQANPKNPVNIDTALTQVDDIKIQSELQNPPEYR